MKIVINNSWGLITEESANLRLDPQFIDDVESGRFVGRAVEGPWGGHEELLKVVEIPDEVTDYRIVTYDGVEGIIYCLNGKIYCINCDNIL